MIGFFYDSWVVILEFLIPGIILGAIYDIFRFFRISGNDRMYNVRNAIKNRFFPKNNSDNKKEKKGQISEFAIVFIEDILFFIIVAIVEILALLHFNNGEIRIGCLIISAVGFFAYQKTIGILTMFFSKKILRLIRRIIFLFVCMVLIPTLFFFKKARKVSRAIFLKRKNRQIK